MFFFDIICRLQEKSITFAEKYITFANTAMDEAILLWVNSHHCAYFDEFMWMLTYRFTWIPMYLAIAYATVRILGWRRGLLYIIAVALTILLADQMCSHVIRPWAERLRPSNLGNPLSAMIHIVHDYRGAPYGMRQTQWLCLRYSSGSSAAGYSQQRWSYGCSHRYIHACISEYITLPTSLSERL